MQPLHRILETLDQEGVEYIVVGGLAVVLWGHPRMTQDVDFVLALDLQNLERAIAAFRKLGLRPAAPVSLEDLLDPTKRQQWIEEKGMVAFALVDPKMPMLTVDLILQSPLPYEALADHAQMLPLGSRVVRVAGIDDLIAMKRHSDRPIDRSDIQALEGIRGNG